MDNISAYNHSRSLLNTKPPVMGVICPTDEKTYSTYHGFSSAVKYVARHISIEKPPTYVEDDGYHLALQQAFRAVDSDRLPTYFRQMVGCLLANEKLLIPPRMYQAAFASEIAKEKDGPFGFLKRLSDEPDYNLNMVYNLLASAGYDVTIAADD